MGERRRLQQQHSGSKRYKEKMLKSKAVQGYATQEENFSALAPYKLVVTKLLWKETNIKQSLCLEI